MTYFRYMQFFQFIFFISGFQFCSENVILLMLKQFDTMLIKLLQLQSRYNKAPVLLVKENLQPCHIFFAFLGTSLFDIMYVLLGFCGTLLFYILFYSLDFYGISFFSIFFHIPVVPQGFPDTLFSDILYLMSDFLHIFR